MLPRGPGQVRAHQGVGVVGGLFGGSVGVGAGRTKWKPKGVAGGAVGTLVGREGAGAKKVLRGEEATGGTGTGRLSLSAVAVE